MINWWDKQISRADELSRESDGSRELLVFYAQLLRAQKEIYVSLGDHASAVLTADLPQDLSLLGARVKALLTTVGKYGTQPLADEARRLLQDDAQMHAALMVYWRRPAAVQFFAKACLQPYLNRCAHLNLKPRGREIDPSRQRCPFCLGRPQVSYLQTQTDSDSGTRMLLCADCLSGWNFPRITCPNCGERDPSKLAYFHSPKFDHIRVEACDVCKHYIKTVDLTRLGFAEPLVDDIASAALDVWADKHDYTKVELNLVGV